MKALSKSISGWLYPNGKLRKLLTQYNATQSSPFASQTLTNIAAERVILRPLTAADAVALFAIFSQPDVMRYWSSPPLQNRQEAEDMLAQIQAALTLRLFCQWGIARREDQLLIGTCTLYHFDEQNRRAEIGFALGSEHWGRGYMREALTALLERAFGDWNLHRIEADVDPRNAASLERLGFQREGYLRERWLVGGESQDSVILGLLRREWQLERQSKL